VEEILLQATGIKMSYNQRPVLGGVSLGVKKGEVCGLLGPNGSGKTTLLKVITGLIRPDQGEIQLFGKDFAPSALRRVGCIIDRPGLYGGKTAMENLKLQGMLLGIPEDRSERLLAQVGLSGTGTKKAGKFSLGMKQRLAIAMALMGSPDLLILDEPVNGLDTQGLYDMRQVLQTLNRENGVTILITSHMLDEVARLATNYAILRDGALRQFSGSEVQEKSRQYAEIVTLDTAASAVLLDAFVQEEDGYEVMPDGSFRLYHSLDRLPEINAALVKGGIGVQSLSLKTGSLADFYLDETGRGNHHA